MSPIPSSHDNEQDGTGYVRVAHEFQWNGVIAKLSAFYDMEYINNRSIINDIKIMFKTVAVIFTHDGAK